MTKKKKPIIARSSIGILDILDLFGAGILDVIGVSNTQVHFWKEAFLVFLHKGIFGINFFFKK